MTYENYQTLNPDAKNTCVLPSLRMSESPSKGRMEMINDPQKKPFESIITQINKQDTAVTKTDKNQDKDAIKTNMIKKND